MTTLMPLRRQVAWAAIFLERYGLSLVFLSLAGVRVHQLLTHSESVRVEIEASPLIGVLRQVIWVQLYLYVGLLLLLGRRVVVPPRTLQDLIVPMGTTFFNLTYAAVPWFPLWLRKNLCPIDWQATCVVTGFAMNLLGLWIAIWGAVYLGRSFSVLIEVRKVIMEGAYRRMRHPMYSGYVFFLTGFAVANFSLAYFILVPVHIFLLLYRARLEENRLAESSPEYKEHLKNTGFIFPKFRRP